MILDCMASCVDGEVDSRGRRRRGIISLAEGVWLRSFFVCGVWVRGSRSRYTIRLWRIETI